MQTSKKMTSEFNVLHIRKFCHVFYLIWSENKNESRKAGNVTHIIYKLLGGTWRYCDAVVYRMDIEETGYLWNLRVKYI